MIRQLIDLFSQHNDPAKLRAIIRKQRDIIDRLRLENAQLRAENRAMRRRLGDKDLRLLRQAETDAVLLGALHFAHQPTSRRACQAVGIGALHWRRAMALLQVARVHDGRGLDVTTPEDFERALRVARERVERDGMETLGHRMPSCWR